MRRTPRALICFTYCTLLVACAPTHRLRPAPPGSDHAFATPFRIADERSADERAVALVRAVEERQRSFERAHDLAWSQTGVGRWYFSSDGTIVATIGPDRVRRADQPRTVHPAKLTGSAMLIAWQWHADSSAERVWRQTLPVAIEREWGGLSGSAGRYVVVGSDAYALLDGSLHRVAGLPDRARGLTFAANGNWCARVGVRYWEPNAVSFLVTGTVSDRGVASIRTEHPLTPQREFAVVWAPGGEAAIINSEQVYSFATGEVTPWIGPRTDGGRVVSIRRGDDHGHVIAGDQLLTLDRTGQIIERQTLRIPAPSRLLHISPSGTQALIAVRNLIEVLPGGVGQRKVVHLDVSTGKITGGYVLGSGFPGGFIGWMRGEVP